MYSTVHSYYSIFFHMPKPAMDETEFLVVFTPLLACVLPGIKDGNGDEEGGASGDGGGSDESSICRWRW